MTLAGFGNIVNDISIPVIGIERLRMGTDGQGIRSLVGTYGCPLRCKYCLNPQSWRPTTVPRYYTPEELYVKLSIDSIYFQATNGGVTFGGGEPLLHITGISEFRKLCPKTWNIWAETSLHVDPELVLQASRVIDHFVVDIKSMDLAEYKSYTGRTGDLLVSNLALLKTIVGSQRITVRIPQIPEYVDQVSQENSCELLSSLGFHDIEKFEYRVDIRK